MKKELYFTTVTLCGKIYLKEHDFFRIDPKVTKMKKKSKLNYGKQISIYFLFLPQNVFQLKW